MKIIHVITGLRKAAGTSVFCAETANELARRGHAVCVARFDAGSASAYPLDPLVHEIDISSPEKAFAGLSKPDAIHIHALWTPVLSRWARAARAHGVPVIWSVHGMTTPWAMRSKRLKKFLAWHLYQRRALAAADAIHVTAEREIEDIRRLGLANPTVEAALGIDVAPIDAFSAGTARREMPQKTLLFVGRINRIKGLDRLARAWGRLPAAVRRSWRVRLVGPDQEGHAGELRALCAKTGIADEWTFAGPRYGNDLFAEYAAADLFVLPSHTENFGSVVLEALAFRIPVIASRGTPWGILAERGCGWHVEGDRLAEALLPALSLEEAERRRMGERGRRLVEEKFTWHAVADVLERAYASLRHR